MARVNFLLGYGERLTEPLPPPIIKPEKKDPYTFSEARSRLAPLVAAASEAISHLPQAACPRDEAVAVMTLHPGYLAKSYYPIGLLRAVGLEAVGSRSAIITPQKYVSKRHAHETTTAELFVAGPRDVFRDWAQSLPTWTERTRGADELNRIESFKSFEPKGRIRLRTDSSTLSLEVVLHAAEGAESDYILDAFRQYLRSLDLNVNLDRRLYAEGLCFLPLIAPRKLVSEIAKFSYLRVAREMPHLRDLRPIVKAASSREVCTYRLPEVGPVDTKIQVAVFDGGVPSGSEIERYARRLKCAGVGASVPEFQEHGLAVTSAFLFGPLESGKLADVPYSGVDHYRILDAATGKKHDDLFDVLERILAVLSRKHYDFVNLSVGPDLPCEDDEVHVWTALLDKHLADGKTFASIAAGNGGDLDSTLGHDRIQAPADCVNGCSVGACDSRGAIWKRANYSSVGPGRSPGIVKPDLVAFGGTKAEPFWVLGPQGTGKAVPQVGTSFAAPTALRAAVGVRAILGPVLSPLAIKALLVNRSEKNSQGLAEVGWGRVPREVEGLVTCTDDTVHVVYQGTLTAGKYVRAPIPVPSTMMDGLVTITATFCFATETDPQDPIHYTRSGLEVVFRPHDQRRSGRDPLRPDTTSFFQIGEYATESELRSDAHKWETTLHKSKRLRGSSLRNPSFDVHYHARQRGQATSRSSIIPYSLVVSVHAPRVSNLYDLVFARYKASLEALKPVVQLPIRIR